MSDINIINGDVLIPEIGTARVDLAIRANKIAAVAQNNRLPSAGNH
jgi:hypothetical protein